MEEITRAVTRSLRFMDILPFVELVERAPRVEVNCYITTSPDIWEIVRTARGKEWWGTP